MINLVLASILMASAGERPEPFPVNEDVVLTAEIKTGERVSHLEVRCRVHRLWGDYVYAYTFTNNGKHPVGFQWDLADEAAGTGPLLYQLPAGESRRVSFVSRRRPVYGHAPGQIVTLIAPGDAGWKDELAARGAKIDGAFFFMIPDVFAGPVPETKKFD